MQFEVQHDTACRSAARAAKAAATAPIAPATLERQDNLNISFGNSNIIGYINVCSDRPTATPDENQLKTPDFQQSKDEAKIETISKLRQFGLSDEQISESLNIPLEAVKQVDLEE